jgi:hypothetical protein
MLMLTRYSYDRNATESPLLRLAPEIRNRIFHFVLGGKTIHIDYFYGHYACRSTVGYEEEAKSTKNSKGCGSIDAHSIQHVACDPETNSVERLQLAVLRACRQIHQEAALVPFSSNIFAFDDRPCFEQFLKKVLLGQARALRHIVFDLKYYQTGMYRYTIDAIPTKLTAVETLTIFLTADDIADGSYSDWFEDYIGSKPTENLKPFRGIAKSKSTVVVCKEKDCTQESKIGKALNKLGDDLEEFLSDKEAALEEAQKREAEKAKKKANRASAKARLTEMKP